MVLLLVVPCCRTPTRANFVLSAIFPLETLGIKQVLECHRNSQHVRSRSANDVALIVISRTLLDSQCDMTEISTDLRKVTETSR